MVELDCLGVSGLSGIDRMGDWLVGLEVLDPLLVCLYMFGVDFVLWGGWVEGA